MSDRWFVTSTGTDVGKTLVTAALVAQLREAGLGVRALKPVLSGFDPGRVEESDTGILLAASGLDANTANIDAMTPWRFREPLSPDMAAAREGRTLTLDPVIAFCQNASDTESGTVIVEGVGGCMAPIDEGHTVLDWISALGWPSLLVTGSYLGTISHTLTTFETMASRGHAPGAIVISESLESPVPMEETRDAIARFLPAPTPFALVPRVAGGLSAWQQVPNLLGVLADRPA